MYHNRCATLIHVCLAPVRDSWALWHRTRSKTTLHLQRHESSNLYLAWLPNRSHRWLPGRIPRRGNPHDHVRQPTLRTGKTTGPSFYRQKRWSKGSGAGAGECREDQSCQTSHSLCYQNWPSACGGEFGYQRRDAEYPRNSFGIYILIYSRCRGRMGEQPYERPKPGPGQAAFGILLWVGQFRGEPSHLEADYHKTSLVCNE